MKRWIEPPAVEVPADLRTFVGGNPLVVETLVRRNFTSVQAARAFLDPEVYSPAAASELPGLAEAVERLVYAIRHHERICVWGDFDVDGQTSTTLLVTALQDCGADVIYHIPVRETESHGMKIPWLEKELARGPKLVLTCDTGIAEHDAIDYARQRGVDVIVTDHHELPPQLPSAHAIVNPHLLPEGHALAALPGVGVAYKLMEALYERLGRAAEVRQYCDLVALGIVSDVAEMVDDTRYLLQQGLALMRAAPRLGLREIMKLANINPTQLDEGHIGFSLGPRLNALGRLGDANPIVEFLTTRDLSRARILASQLEALNARRQMLCQQVFNAAKAKLSADPTLLEYGALVLDNPAWPAGVIGIVASRLVDLYNRPAILISTAPGELGRASARSVAGCHITDAIATQADLLKGFGGHAMAAGLSLDPENIAAFRRGLSQAVAAQLGDARPEATLALSGYLSLSELTLEFVDDLARLAPFGPGNPPLLLATRNVRCVAKPRKSRDGKHLWLRVRDELEVEREVVWWHGGGSPLPNGPFDMAYTLRANTFRGELSLQIVREDFRVLESVLVETPSAKPQAVVIDYRQEPHAKTLLKPLLSQEGAQIWCEGDLCENIGRSRLELESASTLVIWTSPSGPQELQQVLSRVSAAEIYLFAVDPRSGTQQAFLKQLAGLAKYAVSAHQGRVHIPTFAARTAQAESSVRLGIAWLVARGYFRVLKEDAQTPYLADSGVADPQRAKSLISQLQILLEEAAAYRRYFSHAKAAELLKNTS